MPSFSIKLIDEQMHFKLMILCRLLRKTEKRKKTEGVREKSYFGSKNMSLVIFDIPPKISATNVIAYLSTMITCRLASLSNG